jgi:hypothetical protein
MAFLSAEIKEPEKLYKSFKVSYLNWRKNLSNLTGVKIQMLSCFIQAGALR